MGRKVKCFVTGEEGTSDTFIKIGAHYYKSQEVYDIYHHDREAHKAIVNLICDFLDYQPEQKFPTYIGTKLKEYSFYDNEVILETLKRSSDTIRYYMHNKKFENDIRKIQYIFAIVSNNINDVDKEYKWKKQDKNSFVTAETFDNPQILSRPKSGTRDISQWLSEEDV